jgi:hypothetical protein
MRQADGRVCAVHPIERLRYVARSSGAPQELLVAETAGALLSFRDEPTALVTACRRIVARQLSSGAIWWLCSRILCAPDPVAEARAAVEEIEADQTPRHLAAALPDDCTVAVLGWQSVVASALARRGDVEVLVVDTLGEAASFVRYLDGRDVDATEVPLSGLGAAVAAADLVVCEASAAGPSSFLAVAGTRAAASVARTADRPMWLAVGVGRMLPARVWSALEARLDLEDEPWDADDEVIPLELVDVVISRAGTVAPEELASQIDCPIAPELFKADIT